MEETNERISYGGDSGTKELQKQVTTAPVMDSVRVCVLWESGVKRSALCWCVWQDGFSRSENV
jgi:hypothetical protein